MNFRYFACPICREYTSAGYRWAYWQLEHRGFVEPNKPVDLAVLLGADKYWHPPSEPDSAWLYEEIFPVVRTFLSVHQEHGIIFVESGDFFGIEDFESWIKTGKY